MSKVIGLLASYEHGRYVVKQNKFATPDDFAAWRQHVTEN
jgi:hypothetical protein